jgi:hypothetical protein
MGAASTQSKAARPNAYGRPHPPHAKCLQMGIRRDIDNTSALIQRTGALYMQIYLYSNTCHCRSGGMRLIALAARLA